MKVVHNTAPLHNRYREFRFASKDITIAPSLSDFQEVYVKMKGLHEVKLCQSENQREQCDHKNCQMSIKVAQK